MIRRPASRSIVSVALVLSVAAGACSIPKSEVRRGDYVDFVTTAPSATSPAYETYLELADDADIEPLAPYDFELRADSLCVGLLDPSQAADVEVLPDEMPILEASCPEAVEVLDGG